MKHSSISGISVAGQKESPSAMARVLLVGLALLLPGTAALATDPIPGVDVKLSKNPGGIAVSAPTGSDGTYKFTGLAAGNYDLSVGGQRVQTITVGANQGISGVLSRGPDGKASITFNGQGDVVPDLPSAPVNTTRSNKKAGIAKGETPTNGIGGQGGGRLMAGGANADSSNRDHIDQDAQFDVKKRTDVQPDGPGKVRLRISSDVSTLRVQNYGIKATETAPGTDGGDGKLPGILRVINNSEKDEATVEAINGIGGTGGDERDVKLGTAAMANEPLTDGLMILRKNSGGITISTPTGADTEGIRPSLDVDRNNSTDPIVAAPKGGDKELPGLAGEPIRGIDVKLGSPGGNPGGNGVMATLNSSGATVAAETIASSRTDSQGNFHFDKLPAGNYVLTLAGLPSQLITVGPDGIAGGTLKRGPDGSMRIFDRWGNRTAVSSKGGSSKTAEKPGGFGSGNTMGAGLGGMGPGPMSSGPVGPGPTSPGAMGGAMAPGGAMGQGRAMGGAGMGRP